MIEIHMISTTFVVLSGSGLNIQVTDDEVLTPIRDLTGWCAVITWPASSISIMISKQMIGGKGSTIYTHLDELCIANEGAMLRSCGREERSEYAPS